MKNLILLCFVLLVCSCEPNRNPANTVTGYLEKLQIDDEGEIHATWIDENEKFVIVHDVYGYYVEIFRTKNQESTIKAVYDQNGRFCEYGCTNGISLTVYLAYDYQIEYIND